MATDRTTIIRGPGAISFAGVTIHDADGIAAEVLRPTQEIPSSIAGTLESIFTDQTANITATPCGELSAEIIAALYPHQTPLPGSSIMGDTDRPLTIHGRNGRKITFPCAALTGIPALRLSPVATSFGQATWGAALAKGKGPEDADALWQSAAAAYALGEPKRGGLGGRHYAAAWGAGADGLSIPDTAEGWTVEFDLRLEPVIADSCGTIDFTLAGLTVRASCRPLGLTEEQILKALAAPKARGAGASTAKDLVIMSEGGLAVTLKCAGLVQGPLAWGATALRAGELGFTAHRAADGQLYSVAMA